MVTLQEQARALGEPTRHEIFRYLLRAPGEVGVAELTAHLRLHHNAVRQHLAKLVAAGLLVETFAPRARPGRPPLRYRLSSEAENRWGPTGPFERLSHLLLEVIRTGDTPVEVGRRAGRRYRASSGPAPGESARQAVGRLVHTMAREGFDPDVRSHGVRVDVVLRTCPFESTATADPAVVCQLHLGIARGFLEEGDGVVVDELVAGDPSAGDCRLRLRVEAG